MSDFITNAELRIEAERLCDENERLQTENKNLIANYEMLSESYMDSKQACEHLFTELKRYKSLIRVKLPERDLMLIDEIQKLRKMLCDLWRFTKSACEKYPRLFDQSAQGGQMVQLNAIDAFEQRLRELGIEVPE